MMRSQRSQHRRLRLGTILGGLAAFAVLMVHLISNPPMQHPTAIRPAAPSVMHPMRLTRSIFNGDHRIDTCALLPVDMMNAIAPDLTVNKDELLPIGTRPADTTSYEDYCSYNLETATPTGGTSTTMQAGFSIMGYGPRSVVSNGYTTWVNGDMTLNAKSMGGHLNKATKFHAANGAIFDQQAETKFMNGNTPVAFDLLLVYPVGNMSYLIEVSSGTYLPDWTVQNIINVVTGQLPDLTVTSMNMGGDDLQV